MAYTTPTATDEIMSESEVATLIKVSPDKLKMDRHRGIGIPYLKLGVKSVRYRRSDVEQYLREQRVVPVRRRAG
jgi:hypothetical protein